MNAPRFDLPTVQALVAHFATLQGLAGPGVEPDKRWTFATEIVPGLTHQGEPAWATVESDPAARTARIKVRDLATTPIEGAADPWTELKVTISHELWHPWVTWLLANPTEDAEEALVEAAAQAVVRSAGTDARIVARSLRRSLTGVLIDAPAAVRARVAKVSARGSARARGGQMDETQVQAALDALIEEGQGDSKCAGILKTILAALAVKGAGGAPGAVEEPPESMNEPPVEGREEGSDMDPTKNPGATPAGPPAPKPMPRAAKVDEHEARARKAADSIVGSAIRARIREERAGGLTLPAAIEQSMLKMTDLDRFEQRVEDIKAGASLVASGGDQPRGRDATPARPLGTPPPTRARKYNEADLIAEGINPQMAREIANEPEEAAADIAVKAARARIAGSKSPWASKGGAA